MVTENLFQAFFEDLFDNRSVKTYSEDHYDFGHRVNVTVDDEAYRLYMQVPGVRKEDISVNIESIEEHGSKCPVISIKGSIEQSEEFNKEFTVQEFVPAGEFQRRFKLPTDASGDEINASCELGILYVEIPRRKDKSGRKTIEIR